MAASDLANPIVDSPDDPPTAHSDWGRTAQPAVFTRLDDYGDEVVKVFAI